MAIRSSRAVNGIISDSEPETDSDESLDSFKILASGNKQTKSPQVDCQRSNIVSTGRTFLQQKLDLKIRSLKLKQDVLKAQHMVLDIEKQLLEMKLRELNN